MNTDDKIAALKKQIKDLEAQKKPNRSFKEKVKGSAKAIGQSTKTVFNELGKAANEVFDGVGDSTGFGSVDDAIRRMPQ